MKKLKATITTRLGKSGQRKNRGPWSSSPRKSSDFFKEGRATLEQPVCLYWRDLQRVWNGATAWSWPTNWGDGCLRTWLEQWQKWSPNWEYGYSCLMQVTGPPCWIIKREGQSPETHGHRPSWSSALKCLSWRSLTAPPGKGELSKGPYSRITDLLKNSELSNTLENCCNYFRWQEYFHYYFTYIFPFTFECS